MVGKVLRQWLLATAVVPAEVGYGILVLIELCGLGVALQVLQIVL